MLIPSNVKESLEKLSDEERSKAISMLILLGVKLYTSITSYELVDMEILGELYEKYQIEMTQLKDQNGKNRLPFCKYCKRSNSPRRYRADSLSHFPFSDADGTVDDIFYQNNQNARIMNMGYPARKRFACKVFSDMCVGKAKLPVKDIPLALKALGLIVPHGLPLEYFFKIKNDQSIYPYDSTIDLQQWLTIVYNYMNNDVLHTTDSQQIQNDVTMNEINHVQSQQQNNQKHYLGQHHKQQESQQQMKEKNSSFNLNSNNSKKIDFKEIKKNALISQMQQVNCYNSTLAKNKIKNILTDSVVRKQKLINANNLNKKNHQYKNTYTNHVNIAEEFLHSKIGKHFINSDESNQYNKTSPIAKQDKGFYYPDILFDSESSDEKSRLYIRGAEIRRLERRNDKHWKEESIGEGLQREGSTARGGDQNLWRSSKGGWVADFGPVHTHAVPEFFSRSYKPTNHHAAITTDRSGGHGDGRGGRQIILSSTESGNSSSGVNGFATITSSTERERLWEEEWGAQDMSVYEYDPFEGSVGGRDGTAELPTPASSLSASM